MTWNLRVFYFLRPQICGCYFFLVFFKFDARLLPTKCYNRCDFLEIIREGHERAHPKISVEEVFSSAND